MGSDIRADVLQLVERRLTEARWAEAGERKVESFPGALAAAEATTEYWSSVTRVVAHLFDGDPAVPDPPYVQVRPKHFGGFSWLRSFTTSRSGR